MYNTIEKPAWLFVPDIINPYQKRKREILHREFQFDTSKGEILRRCEERLQLCEELQKVDPGNPTWSRYAPEYIQVFPYGRDAIWQLFQKWGVISRTGGITLEVGGIKAPADLVHAYPREFIDLDDDTVMQLVLRHEGLSPAQFVETNQASRIRREYRHLFDLASRARTDCWRQWGTIKGVVTIGNNPLLSGDYIRAILDLQTTVPAPVCFIGLGHDEIDAFHYLGRRNAKTLPAILGINKGRSPILDQRIKRGEIEEISLAPGERISASDLQPGKTYITQYEITNEIPIVKEQFIIAACLVLHHVPADKQCSFIQQCAETAIRNPNNPKERGVVIFESVNVPPMLRFVVQFTAPFYETAGFDGSVSTIWGIHTPRSFVDLALKADSSTDWHTQIYPQHLPPFPFFQKKILPPLLIGLMGSRP